MECRHQFLKQAVVIRCITLSAEEAVKISQHYRTCTQWSASHTDYEFIWFCHCYLSEFELWLWSCLLYTDLTIDKRAIRCPHCMNCSGAEIAQSAGSKWQWDVNSWCRWVDLSRALLFNLPRNVDWPCSVGCSCVLISESTCGAWPWQVPRMRFWLLPH